MQIWESLELWTGNATGKGEPSWEDKWEVERVRVRASGHGP